MQRRQQLLLPRTNLRPLHQRHRLLRLPHETRAENKTDSLNKGTETGCFTEQGFLFFIFLFFIV